MFLDSLTLKTMKNGGIQTRIYQPCTLTERLVGAGGSFYKIVPLAHVGSSKF